ncbi:glycine--tRNA ligase [Candidatus Mycoplasma mahonii]|uniref:glycine--tRNA ligase n=1 Tax=Candidatus Mycoplasma mahonii TaxID=3004105 RepID=UPI0026E97F28|nr:glycine--tRNA ligase [Candidatus Mycoplasma mahonii]WKX02791.1 glycine--tRNA ligase [Candidatus Mycoplasma mahonii]
MNDQKDFKEIQLHLKETGFVFQGSEIYGGLANTWDYGPMGVLLKKNIQQLWWKEFITKEPNNYGLDSKILMNPEVWVASGHVSSFSDPLIENKVNGKRYRADHIIEAQDSLLNAEAMSKQEMQLFIQENIKEYDGAKTNWTDIREFHLMFETHQGVLVDNKSKVFLRPETAQGIFMNFKNVMRTTRAKLPMGIGQVGKSFRNEVTPGNFTFRTREFEQMELEVFVKPGDDEQMHSYYLDKVQKFTKDLGIKVESIKTRIHDQDELAHYSKATTDIEFMFPFGWGELLGVTNRTDFDLKTHMKHSGINLEYRDPITNETFIPYVIEPSIGLDRMTLATLVDAYELDGERIVLKLDKKIVPYKVAVLPLNKKFHAETAKIIFNKLIDTGIEATYDAAGSIGKRYRRQDAIGTPICLTIIDETQTQDKATIRHRDSMKQEDILVLDLNKYI